MTGTSTKTTGVDKAIIHFGIPAIDVFVAANPYLVPLWITAKGFYGLVMQHHQDKVNDFVDCMRENMHLFTEEVVNDENFQEGFVYTLEQFLRQRGEQRRRMIKRIFLGFTSSGDKENFKLEKMYFCINQLQAEDIEALAMIINLSIPRYLQGMRKNMYRPRRNKDETFEEFLAREGVNFRLWFTMGDTLPDSFDVAQKQLSDLGILLERPNFERFDPKGDFPSDKEPRMEYEMTQFGFDFCRFIEPTKIQKMIQDIDEEYSKVESKK